MPTVGCPPEFIYNARDVAFRRWGRRRWSDFSQYTAWAVDVRDDGHRVVDMYRARMPMMGYGPLIDVFKRKEKFCGTRARGTSSLVANPAPHCGRRPLTPASDTCVLCVHVLVCLMGVSFR